jgi:hypothetical protein
MSEKRPISAIETRVTACRLMRSHFPMLGTYLGALLSYWMFTRSASLQYCTCIQRRCDRDKMRTCLNMAAWSPSQLSYGTDIEVNLASASLAHDTYEHYVLIPYPPKRNSHHPHHSATYLAVGFAIPQPVPSTTFTSSPPAGLYLPSTKSCI